MAQPPQITPEQRAAALAKATLVRRERAELKAQLKMGAVTFSELVARVASDEVVAKTKVLTVLESLPGVGKVKARRIMEDVGIAESRRMRGLGEQQTKTLLEQFGD